MDVEKYSGFMLCILFLCLSLEFHVSFGGDRITANQSLSGDQTIVSAGGVFRVGFFKPGNSSNYYVGMWHNRVSSSHETKIVWVANREAPVSDRFSCELRISGGDLVLVNESNVSIWSTNLNSTSTSATEAVLGDDGNLVLRDGSNSNSSEPPLWQSFDHPSDSWFPGARIGVNKITNRKTRLISWKGKDDPSPGLFSFELSPAGATQYVTALWNGTKPYFTGKISGANPRVISNYFYNFSYVDNDTDSYFTYILYNTSFTSVFSLDVVGQIQQLVWQESTDAWGVFSVSPRDKCQVYAYCGRFGICNMNSQPFCDCQRGFIPRIEGNWASGVYSGGCARRTSLQCQNSSLANGTGKNDRFSQIVIMELPDNARTVAVSSQQECESNCLSNCACNAYAFDSSQCSVWYGDLWNLRRPADSDPSARINLYVRLAATEFPKKSRHSNVLIWGAIGMVLVVVLFSLVLFILLRRRKRRCGMEEEMDNSLVVFDYRALKFATKNFSEKLGGGGFGSVFKGTLPDKSVVAVKMLQSISQGEKQFRAEVGTIGTIKHLNLVRLRGFCSDGNRKLLVYDYMPNGSLDSHLFDAKGTKVLDWKTRYMIALDTARGLAYLHENCRECIIHCDIKPDNILLDEQFGPKIADFGLAKLFGRDFSRVLTTMRGTIGYLAPEWITGVAVTTKADVYSYGMMLFELVSGRRNSETPKDGRTEYFPVWMASVINERGDVLSLLDPKLEGSADIEEVKRVCKVACWCIQDDETKRPTMGQVIHFLEGLQEMNLPPISRFLQSMVYSQEDISKAENIFATTY